MSGKSLIILESYHHRNTEKVAKAIAGVLKAHIKRPQDVEPEEVGGYGLVGFGSGIYDARHHLTLLSYADRLPQVSGKRAFLFSTYGAPPLIANEKFILSNHATLKDKLIKKGFQVVGDFACAGFNTNSFLKTIGGLNRDRPNADDIRRAEEFAQDMMGTHV